VFFFPLLTNRGFQNSVLPFFFFQLYLDNIQVEDHDDAITMLLGFLNKNITSYISSTLPCEENKTVQHTAVCETGRK
jgi:hypothetical protein